MTFLHLKPAEESRLHSLHFKGTIGTHGQRGPVHELRQREAGIYLEHHTFKSVSSNSPGSFSAVVLIESVLEKSLLY